MRFQYLPIGPDAYTVKLGGRTVGRIVQAVAGFRYFPKGGRDGGAIYATLKECKQSLEED